MSLSIIGCVVNGPGEALMNDVAFTGGGNGSFLRWCHYKNIIYDDFLIIDNDETLLKSFYPRTKSYLSMMSLSLIKDNMMSYRIQNLKKNKDGFITLKKQDFYKSIDIINDYNLVSFSAVNSYIRNRTTDSNEYIFNLFHIYSYITKLYP